MRAKDTQTLAKVPEKHNVNEMCIIIWQDTNAKYEWYIGYIKDITAAERDISPDSRKRLFSLRNIQQVQAAVQKVF